MLRLIVGLGNPGTRYQGTRHNAGKWFVELLAKQHGVAFKTESKFFSSVSKIAHPAGECWLLSPTTYMNLSGQAVGSFLHYYNIPLKEILVAHDEIDLPPGVIKLKRDGGHAGHNGLRHIMECLGGQSAFQRLRIGVGRPAAAAFSVSDYVLSAPPIEEREAILDAIDRALAVFPDVLAGAWQAAVNKLHSIYGS